MNPGVHILTIRKVRKTAAGEGFRPLHVINDNSYCRALLRMTASSLRNHMLGSFPSSNRPVSERCWFVDLKQWLINHKCFDACMESTGKYWIPIFNILEDEINIYLTHPKYVKAIKGKKTDKKDSKWICDLFKHDLIKFSFIPPKEIRALPACWIFPQYKRRNTH